MARAGLGAERGVGKIMIKTLSLVYFYFVCLKELYVLQETNVQTVILFFTMFQRTEKNQFKGLEYLL